MSEECKKAYERWNQPYESFRAFRMGWELCEAHHKPIIYDYNMLKDYKKEDEKFLVDAKTSEDVKEK